MRRHFHKKKPADISIISGADGPTAIYVTSRPKTILRKAAVSIAFLATVISSVAFGIGMITGYRKAKKRNN